MTAPLLSPFAQLIPGDKLNNWAGNIEYSTNKLYMPACVQEVTELVKKYSRIKVLGTRHCFNTIADSKDNFISLAKLNKVVGIDTAAHTVTIEAGMNYGQLCPYLQERGYALHNLASLPHISVVGACTTATHGSGLKNGNLATAVRGIELVTAAGAVHTLRQDKDGEHFNAAVVGLGGLGVITKLTLALQPSFSMRQDVYEQLPMTQLKDHFNEIMGAGYSVSLFTDWQSENISEVWIKSRVTKEPFEHGDWFFGAKAAIKNMHPIANLPAENCTEQMGVAGAWYERLPHFKMGFTPSSGVELQSEYFVPHQHAVNALFAIAALGRQIGPYLFISEIRGIDADNYWMSPCYKQPSVTLHFTWKQDWAAVRQLLPLIEKALAPFRARPHWGKLFTMQGAELLALYERLPAFRQVLQEYDPCGKFRNDFLDSYVYG
ncbi:MAG: D-arabinono-1,4-lactone oxidase [Bacteroidota bacterium]